MKIQKIRSIVYQTTGPDLPDWRDITERERRRLLERASTYDVFLYADLVRDEGLLGRRSPRDRAFRAWATARMRDKLPGTKELSPSVLRSVVALVRSGQPLTALEARSLGNPASEPIAEASARAALNKGLAAIDCEVKPSVRLSTLRHDARDGEPARFQVRFGWAAASDGRAPHSVLNVCLVVVEEVEVPDPVMAPPRVAKVPKPPREPRERPPAAAKPARVPKERSTAPARPARRGRAPKDTRNAAESAELEPGSPLEDLHASEAGVDLALLQEKLCAGYAYEESVTVRWGFHKDNK